MPSQQVLSVLLGAEFSASVGHADVQLPGAFYNILALARRDVVSDFRGVLPVCKVKTEADENMGVIKAGIRALL